MKMFTTDLDKYNAFSKKSDSRSGCNRPPRCFVYLQPSLVVTIAFNFPTDSVTEERERGREGEKGLIICFLI